MTGADTYDSIERYVADNRERLVHVLRHSNDEFARACCWALLDAGLSGPDLAQLQQELDAVQERHPA